MAAYAPVQGEPGQNFQFLTNDQQQILVAHPDPV